MTLSGRTTHGIPRAEGRRSRRPNPGAGRPPRRLSEQLREPPRRERGDLRIGTALEAQRRLGVQVEPGAGDRDRHRVPPGHLQAGRRWCPRRSPSRRPHDPGDADRDVVAVGDDAVGLQEGANDSVEGLDLLTLSGTADAQRSILRPSPGRRCGWVARAPTSRSWRRPRRVDRPHARRQEALGHPRRRLPARGPRQHTGEEPAAQSRIDDLDLGEPEDVGAHSSGTTGSGTLSGDPSRADRSLAMPRMLRASGRFGNMSRSNTTSATMPSASAMGVPVVGPRPPLSRFRSRLRSTQDQDARMVVPTVRAPQPSRASRCSSGRASCGPRSPSTRHRGADGREGHQVADGHVEGPTAHLHRRRRHRGRPARAGSGPHRGAAPSPAPRATTIPSRPSPKREMPSTSKPRSANVSANASGSSSKGVNSASHDNGTRIRTAPGNACRW